MNAFITHQSIKEKHLADEFDTYVEAQGFLERVWTPKERTKWKLEVRPKERIGQQSILMEDV